VDVLRTIEHTALKAETTPGDVEGLCEEAARYGFHGVCVNPIHVARARQRLQGTSVRVVTVIGFPLGAGSAASDQRECERVIELGAHELDWVIPIGLALSGDIDEVVRRAQAVRDASRGVTLKIIFECGHFEANTLRGLAERVMAVEPEFLKTATGFGPRGASVEDVRTLAAVAGRAGVKASAGIRSLADVTRMIDAGATRIGTSSGVAIAEAVRSGSAANAD
jgi:deoxyribose-phosphate aldolase